MTTRPTRLTPAMSGSMACYDAMMDDRHPLGFDAAQKVSSPNGDTLAAAIESLCTSVGQPFDAWDEIQRLAFVGVVVRHAEFGVAIPDDWRQGCSTGSSKRRSTGES